MHIIQATSPIRLRSSLLLLLCRATDSTPGTSLFATEQRTSDRVIYVVSIADPTFGSTLCFDHRYYRRDTQTVTGINIPHTNEIENSFFKI